MENQEKLKVSNNKDLFKILTLLNNTQNILLRIEEELNQIWTATVLEMEKNTKTINLNEVLEFIDGFECDNARLIYKEVEKKFKNE